MNCVGVGFSSFLRHVWILPFHAGRVAWLGDPYGFWALYPDPLQVFLQRIPTVIFFAALLTMIAMWQRVVLAGESLIRIRSAVMVGRYKWIIWGLVAVLIGAVVLGALGSSNTLDRELMFDIMRGIFGIYACGYAIWGTLYAVRFNETLDVSAAGAAASHMAERAGVPPLR